MARPIEVPRVDEVETAAKILYQVDAGILSLNLRAGPGKLFPSLGLYPKGTVVVLVEIPDSISVPGWLPVEIEGEDKAGWMDADFLKEV